MNRISLMGVVIVCAVVGEVGAEVPQLLNYQGKLTDARGLPITGTVALGFGFYNDPTAGKLLYYEEQATVRADAGVFHVLIGNGTAQSGRFSSIYGEETVYLQITVDPQSHEPQVMLPRQRIASTVFALKAGTVEGLAELTARVAELEIKLARVSVSTSGDDITITGANLHIVNGTGGTKTANGLGNLIVGYNELRGGGDLRTGSHNVVIGSQNNYVYFGGLVAGQVNTISGSFASVCGGTGNTASGPYACVSGGWNNTASGDVAWVGGGWVNFATGDRSSVSGGSSNKASGLQASVTGGQCNEARGDWSSVVGGGGGTLAEGNVACARYAAILGGTENIAGDPDLFDMSIGERSTVSGGYQNVASGWCASVSGGYSNEASGSKASVSGGDQNRATASTSSVAGGHLNLANGQYAAISGGQGNVASGSAASVSGGSGNQATGNYAGVSGGVMNIAGGLQASVSGGAYNTASGNCASVSGGGYNTASGDCSSVAGGGGQAEADGNHAYSHYSAILGGGRNVTGETALPDRTLGIQATVSGGWLNVANNTCSSVSGGSQNYASGSRASVSGELSRSAVGTFDWRAGSLLEDF